MKNAELLMAPIGLFDSGVGGTTIWKEINALMPNENTLFLADNKNAPYGEKTKEEIIALCDANTQFLLNHNAKIIVVACNTGTTNAIAYLRDKYKQVPFIGIEPAIKPAGLQSITKKIGVLATRRTLTSDLFAKTSEHLQPMVAEGIDYLVLGCTHYPYLLPQIQQFIPASIKVIDSGYAVARQTRNILAQYHLLNEKQDYVATHKWVTNGNLEILKQFAAYKDEKKHSIEVLKI